MTRAGLPSRVSFYPNDEGEGFRPPLFFYRRIQAMARSIRFLVSAMPRVTIIS